MPTQVRHAGTWKPPVRRWVRHQGVWKSAYKVWVRRGGVWVLDFTETTASMFYAQSLSISGTPSSATVSWQHPNATNGIKPSHYTLGYYNEAGTTFYGSVDTTSTSATIGGLAADTVYRFRLFCWFPDNSGEVQTPTELTWYTGRPASGVDPAVSPGATRPGIPPVPASVFTSRVAWNVGRLNWSYPGGDVTDYQVFVDGTYVGNSGGAGIWDYVNNTEFASYNLGVRSVSSVGTVSGIVYRSTTNGEKPWTFAEAVPVPAGAESEHAPGSAGYATIDGDFNTGWVSGNKGSTGGTTYWNGYVPPGNLAGVALFIYPNAPLTMWASFGFMPAGGWNDFGKGDIPPGYGPAGVHIMDQWDNFPSGVWQYWWFGGDHTVPGALIQPCPGGSYGVRLTFTNLQGWTGGGGLTGFRANIMEVRWLMASK